VKQGGPAPRTTPTSAVRTVLVASFGDSGSGGGSGAISAARLGKTSASPATPSTSNSPRALQLLFANSPSGAVQSENL
jgi:hypothetical protein